MPLSFPNNPTSGQQATVNGRVWSWTGYAWELVASGGGGSGLSWSSVPASPTASGTAGQIAYDGGRLYVCVAADSWLMASLEAFAPQNAILSEGGDYLTTETGDPLVTA